MYLTIDMGNSATKLVLYEQDEIVVKKLAGNSPLIEIRKLVHQYRPSKSMLSSVIDTPKSVSDFLRKHTHFLSFDSSTALPVKNKYQTPHTLGKDRLAGVIGAASLFPGKNILVIDAGTCIKYDFINSKKEYLGGSISPGLHMRYKALHTFTGKLPLVSPGKSKSFYGRNTHDAILTGVQIGIEHEMKGFVQQYKKLHKGLKLVMTGGDLPRFVKRLNLPIFAAPDLVNLGLKEILKFHDSKE